MAAKSGERLASLASEVARDIERTEAAGRVWLEPPAQDYAGPAYNVVVCGAGQTGLGTAFGLKLRGVRGVLVIDAKPPGQEGPWVTSARMKTLRSPKHLAGLDFGIPSLTLRAWYDATFGSDAWHALERIDRRHWMDYLTWYRSITEPEISSGTRLTGVRPLAGSDPAMLELELMDLTGRRRIYCRHLVLATGILGCGGAHVPDMIRALPKTHWTHSAECRDTTFLKDKRVLVVGASTSGFDWAVHALEAGARDVTMIARGTRLARTEVLDWSNFPGFLMGLADWSDAERWRFARRYFTLNQPPTQDQFDRAVTHPRFSLHLGRPLETAAIGEKGVELRAGGQDFTADHLLLGTGYAMAPARAPELAALLPAALFWRDRQPRSGDSAIAPRIGDHPFDQMIGDHPYLGPSFEFLPRQATDAWISRVHLVNTGAIPSLGPVSNGITGVKFGLKRIVDGLVTAFAAADADRILDSLDAYAYAHFDPRQHGLADAMTEECQHD